MEDSDLQRLNLETQDLNFRLGAGLGLKACGTHSKQGARTHHTRPHPQSPTQGLTDSDKVGSTIRRDSPQNLLRRASGGLASAYTFLQGGKLMHRDATSLP